MTALPHNQGHCQPDCFGCKAASVSVSSKALPTRGASTNAQEKYRNDTKKDLDAYKRLRSEGLQPKGTRGAARIEARANTRFEVENGVIIPHSGLANRVDSTQRELANGGLVSTTAST